MERYKNTNAVSRRQSGKELLTVTDGKKDAIEYFLRSIDVRDSSRRKYRIALSIFFRWVEDSGRDLSSLTAADIVAYKDYIDPGQKRSVLTAKLYMSVLRRFYRFLESEKIYPDITGTIRIRREKQGFVKMHLTATECEEILSALDPANVPVERVRFGRGAELDSRNYALINLMLRTGLRTIEVSRLNVGDITIRGGRKVLMVWGKGHSCADTPVPLSDKALAPLEHYLHTRTDAGEYEPLFVCEGKGSAGRRLSARSVQKICKDALRRIGLDSHAYSAHSLRHTCAVQILLSGGDMYDVKFMLRHENAATSEIYVKSIEEERMLAKSPDKYIDKSF